MPTELAAGWELKVSLGSRVQFRATPISPRRPKLIRAFQSRFRPTSVSHERMLKHTSVSRWVLRARDTDRRLRRFKQGAILWGPITRSTPVQAFSGGK